MDPRGSSRWTLPPMTHLRHRRLFFATQRRSNLAKPPPRPSPTGGVGRRRQREEGQERGRIRRNPKILAVANRRVGGNILRRATPEACMPSKVGRSCTHLRHDFPNFSKDVGGDLCQFPNPDAVRSRQTGCQKFLHHANGLWLQGGGGTARCRAWHRERQGYTERRRV